MKKLIVSLASIMGITLTTTAVVSCGITFNVLLQRKVNTNEFKGYFQFNPNSLVSAKTMVAQDFELISDLNVPLVGVDQFDRTIGELAVKFNPQYEENEGDLYVGNRVAATESTKESWTYLINKNAQWSNANLETKGQITGNDFVNIFLYIAHPETASETKSFWISYIDGAGKLINYIDNGNGEEGDKEEGKSLERYKEVYTAIKGEVNKNSSSFDGEEGFTLNGKTEEYTLGIKTGLVKELEDQPAEGHPGKGILFDDNSQYVTWYGPEGTPLPFFDSLMSYASFAPIPDQAVDMAESKPGKAKTSFSNYMTTQNYAETGLFSGPFILSNLQASQSIEYVKNKNYVNAKDVNFEKITKTFKSKATDGELRTSFEAGDLTEFKLRPTDPQGWKKYVGSNVEKPLFDGVTVEESKTKSSFGIYFNAMNSKLWTENKGEAEKNTRILSSSLIRQYIMTTIQKSWMSKYYSSAIDQPGENHKSYTSINTLMPVNFARDADGKDYIGYLADELKDAAIDIIPDIDSETIEKALQPGNDFYSKHDTAPEGQNEAPIGYKMIRQIKGVDEAKQEVSEQDWINSVIEEVNALVGDEKVVLNHLTNGARANTENRFTQNMIDIFNRSAKADGVNITIKQDQTNDESEFKAKRVSAAFDFVITGWSPDFSDPISYLNTQTLNGDLANYYGIHRMINSKKTEEVLEFFNPTDPDPTDPDPTEPETIRDNFSNQYSEMKEKELLNKTYLTDNKNTQESIVKYIKDISDYTLLVNNAAAETELPARYKAFAEAEKMFLIDKSFMVPIYDPWVIPLVKMTFVKPYHYSTIGYGTSQYVHRGWEILSKMPTRNGGVGVIDIEKKWFDAYKNAEDGMPNSGICLATHDENGNFNCDNTKHKH